MNKNKNKIVITILCAVLLGLGLTAFFQEPATVQPTDTERIAKNRAMLEECKGDPKCLIGGFVEIGVDSNHFIIAQIAPCDNCSHYEVSASRLTSWAKTGRLPSEYKEIALPHNRAQWEKFAIRYAEQFVVHHK